LHEGKREEKVEIKISNNSFRGKETEKREKNNRKKRKGGDWRKDRETVTHLARGGSGVKTREGKVGRGKPMTLRKSNPVLSKGGR